MSHAQKKCLIRALVDKVVLRQPQVGQVEVRIVWKSGMLTSKTIDVKVGSLSALPGGDELKEKVIKLAKAGDSDELIAYHLSRDGYRGCDRSYVGLGIVRRLRCDAGIKHEPSAKLLKSEGKITLAQLAARLHVKIDWLFEQIIFEKVCLEPDLMQKRFMIAADSELIGKLESLRSIENASRAKRGASR